MKVVCLFLALVLGTQATKFERPRNRDQQNEEIVHNDDEIVQSGEEQVQNEEELVQNDEELVQNDEGYLPRNSDNWQEGKSLREAMEYLFVFKVGADVTFILTDQTGPSQGVPVTFKAHKTILTARSSVMSSLLTNVTSTSEPVSITDVDPEAFRQMLQYMYTDQPHITADNVLYVAAAARTYNVPGLQTLCGEYLLRDLSENTVLAILKQGVYFDDRNLIQKCLDVISDAASSVLSSPAFLSITPDMMAHVAGIQTINAYEVEMFRTSFKWAREECLRRQQDNCSSTDTERIREILEPFIYHIRFPSMSIAEFTDEVVVRGVLSAEEISLVYQQIVGSTPPQSPFQSQNRGQPVHFPGDMILNYQRNLSRSATQKGRLMYSPTCFVNWNVTLFKIHLLVDLSDDSTIKITIKQNNKNLFNRPRNPPERNNFDDDDVVSFNLTSSVNIDEGYFTVYVDIRHPKGYEPAWFEYSPGWQKQQNGEVEWWCESQKSPFYGLQYKTRSTMKRAESISTMKRAEPLQSLWLWGQG